MILYEQTMPIKGKELDVRGQEDLFVARMSAAFGGLPCQLDKTNIERLEGMKAATLGEHASNPYDDLIRAIKRFGTIKVWMKFDPFEEKNGSENSD